MELYGVTEFISYNTEAACGQAYYWTNNIICTPNDVALYTCANDGWE